MTASPAVPGDVLWTSTDRAVELMRVVAAAKDAPVGLSPKEAIWRKNKARVFHYRRTTAATRRTPVFLCLPLINRAYILDLRPGNSFVEFLVAAGHDVFLLDWGTWAAEDRNITITDLVERYLPRAIRHASAAVGGPVTLLGYCIGGVLATCFMALHPEAPVRNLVLFTTPIDFADAGQFGSWTAKGAFPIDEIRATLDVVPAELIDIGAKMLNPLGSTVGTYLQLYDRLGDPHFDPRGWQAMYRWVNEGTPFPAAAYHQWITEFYQDNKLVKDTLAMTGRPVRLSRIGVPFLNVAATADTIAPRSTTRGTTARIGSPDKEEILIEGGHVGIVVGRSAKSDLWPRVAEWLARHD